MAKKRARLSREDWLAQKAEKDAKVKDDASLAVTQLLDKLLTEKDQEKAAGAMRSWLHLGTQMYGYSFSNIMLIAFQKPDASFVASYERWQQIFKKCGLTGRAFISKGSGIAIRVPRFRKKTEEESELGRKASAAYFGLAHVFDISSVKVVNEKGEEEPFVLPKEQTVNECTPQMMSLYSDFKALALATFPYLRTIREEPLKGANGYCRYLRQEHDGHPVSEIVLDSQASSADKLRVLCHELTHAQYHMGERGLTTSEHHERKSVVEVEAEGVAFIVASKLGIDSSDSAFYMAAFEGNRETAQESLKRIHEHSLRIIKMLDSILQPVAIEIKEEAIA